MKTSKPLAFTTGIATAIPVLAERHMQMADFSSRFVVVMLCLFYIAAIFTFVFGPQQWSTFRCVPVDGTLAAVIPGAAWLLGGLIRITLLEVTIAI